MSEKKVSDDPTFDTSSDDEAPDEMAVSSARKERVAQLRSMQVADKKKKADEKERRRQRHEMFHQQKERKLKELSKRMLPADVLEGIPAKSSRLTQGVKDGVQGEEKTDDLAEENVETDENSSVSGNEDEGFDEKADFIPLGSSNLAVVTQDQVSKIQLSSVQAALNFKQNHFYGQKHIPRQTTQERQARAAKKRALHQR